jgi:hypothetical protein
MELFDRGCRIAAPKISGRVSASRSQMRHHNGYGSAWPSVFMKYLGSNNKVWYTKKMAVE